jgi:RNA polymerase sigma factor (sigma-70 family)
MNKSFKLSTIETNIEQEVNIRKAKTGNEEERSKLVYKLLPYIKKQATIYNRLNEDLLQYLIEKLFEIALKNFDPSKGNTFMTYYYRLAKWHRQMYMEELEQNKHFSLEKKDKNGMCMLHQLKGNINVAEEVIDELFLKSAFKGLSNMDKRILKEYYINNKTYSEIADIEGCTRQWIHAKMKKIKNTLRKRHKWQAV